MSLQGIFEVINKYQSLNYFDDMNQRNHHQRIIRGRASGLGRAPLAIILSHWDH